MSSPVSKPKRASPQSRARRNTEFFDVLCEYIKDMIAVIEKVEKSPIKKRGSRRGR